MFKMETIVKLQQPVFLGSKIIAHIKFSVEQSNVDGTNIEVLLETRD
jgi:hypothetical protein